MFGIRYPIIGAPMFLVSNADMVVAVSEAGGIGTVPALNYRPIEQYAAALREIRSRTSLPWGVNIIVNKSNTRQDEDLRHALDAGCALFITSLGNPAKVIREAHANGARVFCDVTNLTHARKVADQGADGIVAVGAGAGGHAGPVSPIVMIPWFREVLKLPIIAAGGFATGRTLAAALALGADAVHVGTRFIASSEARVDQAYKQAVVDSDPEDIVMTARVSGTPAAVIRTPYVDSLGVEPPLLLRLAKNRPLMKKNVLRLMHLLRVRGAEHAEIKPTWKSVWSAGQSVGLVHEVKSCREIVDEIVAECLEVMAGMRNMVTQIDDDGRVG